MKSSFFLFALGVLLLGTSCKKEAAEPALPAITQTGENRAGCRVDGRPWVAYNSDIFGGKATVAQRQKLLSGKQTLTIYLDKYDDDNEVHSATNIILYVPDINAPGTFALDQPADPQLTTSNPAYGQFTFARPTPERWFLTGPAAGGQLVITRLDTVARVVAGTFAFTAQLRASQASVQVTDGRFDIKY